MTSFESFVFVFCALNVSLRTPAESVACYETIKKKDVYVSIVILLLAM